MEEINTTISIFLVHLNKLNALVKNKMIISPDLNINLAMWCLQEAHVKHKGSERLKWRHKKEILKNINQNNLM